MSDIQKQLMDQMLKIRRAEEKIVEVYAKEQTMRTPSHLSIGQEAVAAGLAVAMRPDDQVFTGHRCHAAYLAKGGDFNAFFAELCGRSTGISGGRAGSAHLTDPSVHVYSSPILGAMIPVAVGAAMSFKMDGKDSVAVSIFGDAVPEEGVFPESLNFAITKKLPVLFLCENNMYSTHSPLSVRQPPSPIYERVRTPELKTQLIDGNDVELVYETLKKVIDEIRRTGMPQFVECTTYRFREHVGPLFDYDRGYRTKEEVDLWMSKCPIKRFSKKLIDAKVMTQADIDAMENKWKEKSDNAYAAALKAPWPEALSLTENVY
jgi:TPP-dependent pyruvate/acetoin dehydrogenase alpha subunit